MFMFKKLKIRNKMLLSILSINLIMMIVIYFVYFGYSKKMMINENQEKTMEKVKGVSSAIEGYFKEKGKIAWTYCQNPYLKRWLENNTYTGADFSKDKMYQDIIAHFKDLVANDSEIKAAFLASEKTQKYYEDAERITPEDYLVGKRPWYIKVKNRGEPLFNCDVDLLDKQVYLNYLYPIYNDDGKLLGVGGIDISLSNLQHFMSKLDIFETGIAFLVGEDGLILYHPNEELVFKRKITEFKDDDNLFKNMNNVSKNILNGHTGIEEVVFDGGKRYFNYTPIKDLGWTLVLSVDTREINAPLSRLSRTSIIVIVLTSIFLVGAIVLITATISKPIRKLVSMFKDIAEGEGNLTKRLEVDSQDEIGELAHWFNIFMDKLHGIITQLKKSTVEVTRATSDISSTSMQLASGAEEQNSQASEVAISVQQMAAVIVQNSQNAASTAKIAEQASKKAMEGSRAMQATQEGMNEIVESSTRAGDIVDSLSSRADQIGAVIRVIDDIAAQTNLLALNAAIEAASAGEHGRGFTVVADEVRALAERTKHATGEIAKTIQSIQEDARGVAESMNVALAAVSNGKEEMMKTDEVLNDIVKSVSQAVDMTQQIATASKEQSSGVNEISKNVAAISVVTKQSASGAEQMAATAEQLNSQTEALRRLVSKFKIRNGDLMTEPASCIELANQ